MSPLHRNLPTLQVLALLFMFDMTVPVRQIIYSEGGLNQSAIGVVLAVPWIVILLTDVPTGRLADEYNYKYMLVSGCALIAISFALLAVADDFWSYFASAILLGLGYSCCRGVPQALGSITFGALHDAAIKRRYKKFVQWSLALGALGEAFASLSTFGIIRIAGEADGIQLAVRLQVVVYGCMALVALLGLTDIRPKGSVHRGFYRTLLTGWKVTFDRVWRVFHEVPLVRAIVLYGAVIGCTTQTMVWLTQVYLQRTGTSAEMVPILWLAYYVALFVFTFLIVPYERLMGRWGALASLPVIAMAAYLMLIWIHPDAGKALIVVFYFVRAMQMGIITVYLMTLVAEHLRATIASVMSTIQFALYSVMSVAINASVDAFPHVSHGTGVAFGLSAAVYGVGGVCLVWYIRRHQEEASS